MPVAYKTMKEQFVMSFILNLVLQLKWVAAVILTHDHRLYQWSLMLVVAPSLTQDSVAVDVGVSFFSSSRS